jgi:hypothetical protein
MKYLKLFENDDNSLEATIKKRAKEEFDIYIETYSKDLLPSQWKKMEDELKNEMTAKILDLMSSEFDSLLMKKIEEFPPLYTKNKDFFKWMGITDENIPKWITDATDVNLWDTKIK